MLNECMKSAFSRRGPDIVTEELAAVLSKSQSLEFKPLFEVLHTNLRARNAASGGEEMLRLRAYEKLQFLVQQGVVKKTEKKYKGVASALEKFLAAAAEQNAKVASGNHRPTPRPEAIVSVLPVEAVAAVATVAVAEVAIETVAVEVSEAATPAKKPRTSKAKSTATAKA
jgi:hypothetical protein